MVSRGEKIGSALLGAAALAILIIVDWNNRLPAFWVICPGTAFTLILWMLSRLPKVRSRIDADRRVFPRRCLRLGGLLWLMGVFHYLSLMSLFSWPSFEQGGAFTLGLLFYFGLWATIIWIIGLIAWLIGRRSAKRARTALSV